MKAVRNSCVGSAPHLPPSFHSPGRCLLKGTRPLQQTPSPFTPQVVAFIKGTRTQPQCGFSFKMLQLLNENKADFEVVNVLDDVYNPGLREAIKTYSQWPTIPQLYIKGEFVGGADIVEKMNVAGELQQMLQS